MNFTELPDSKRMTANDFFKRYDRISDLYNSRSIGDDEHDALEYLLETADVYGHRENLPIVDELLEMYEGR